jgi:hypothetical protein
VAVVLVPRLGMALVLASTVRTLTLVEGVRWMIPVETSVDEVCECLGGGTEVRSRIHPAHREPEGKSYHKFVARLGWEDDAELGAIGRIDANTVDTVGDVNFDQVDRVIVGIGVENSLEDAW